MIDFLGLLKLSLLFTDSLEVASENPRNVLIGLIICRREFAHRHMVGCLIKETLLEICAVELG